MKKEDYISLEVAKLLKEKGYHESCNLYYYEEERIGDGELCVDWNNKFKFSFSCPTLYEAQKWIRESKKLNIMVDFDESQLWGYSILKCYDEYSLIASDDLFNTYEEALDYGILEALKLI